MRHPVEGVVVVVQDDHLPGGVEPAARIPVEDFLRTGVCVAPLIERRRYQRAG